MPKQFRWAIKQKLDSVMIEQQKSADKLTEIAALFKDTHPEYFEAFSSIIVAQLGLKESVQNMSDAI